MANIRLSAKCELYDGMAVTFKAPCDCTAVDGLNIHVADTKQTFTFRDAHGNDLKGTENLFLTGTYVTVILDTTKAYAYIQNADTNTYLEHRLNTLTDEMPSVDATLGIEGAAADAKIVGDVLTELWNRPSVSVDASLSVEGMAADAKAVGDTLATLATQPTATDFSDWDDGSFTVQMSDGTIKDGSVTFDSNGNPKSITLDGHTVRITLPEMSADG